MKYIKTISTLILSLSFLTATGQTEQNSALKNETKEKTYSFVIDGKTYENSVKINTVIRQAVMTDLEDKGKVNGDRVFPPKVVVKKVWIDNDKDAAYDEYVKFSYLTEKEGDFTLVSNGESFMLGLDEGTNVTILNNMTIMKEQAGNKESKVFTMNDGAQVSLKIEDYKEIKIQDSK